MYHCHLGRHGNCYSSKDSCKVLGEDRANGREAETEAEAEPAMQRGAGKRDIKPPKGKEGLEQREGGGRDSLQIWAGARRRV